MNGEASMRCRLRDAITNRRPQNGWITSGWILNGWTAQPAYNDAIEHRLSGRFVREVQS